MSAAGLVMLAVPHLIKPRAIEHDRLDGIAQAVQHVVDTERLPYTGKHAKAETALMLVSIAFNESSFREDVQSCDRKGKEGEIGLTQLYEGPNWGGHTEEEICGSVELQFRLALRVITRSKPECGDSERLWLGAYNSGRCIITTESERAYRTFLGLWENVRRQREWYFEAA